MQFSMQFVLLFLTSMIFDGICGSENSTLLIDKTKLSRAKRQITFVSFRNEFCPVLGGSYNGTCYSSQDCSSLGGISAGPCVLGYGVCCVFVLGCGGKSNHNGTYIFQNTTNSLSTPTCKHTICPNANICRIRFDFEEFVLAKPSSGMASTSASLESTTGGSLGDCVTDSFSISSPGNRGTPVICGYNSGQHMIVDASPLCHQVAFQIGAAIDVTRKWKIKVTQYDCGSQLLSGPPDCLQYFTGTRGTISSFNFPTMDSADEDKAQHLSNQCYTICIRREINNCAICYSPTNKPFKSFGLSLSPSSSISSGINTDCSTDYIMIPGGTTSSTLYQSTVLRNCGRFFDSAIGGTSSSSICTLLAPFRITFKTDEDEVTTFSTPPADASKSELYGIPSGTVGFSLGYEQLPCNF